MRRKLDTLEVKWRKEFERRGSGTGTENEGDMSQAMEAWIAIRDEEHKRTAERVAANSQARKEREVSSKWRANAVLRVRDRPPVVTRELPPEHDYTDLTSDDEAALMPTQQHDVASTAAATVASTPTRSGGSGSRGRGVTRPSVSRRRNSSSRSRSSTSTLALLLQLEERRQAREEAAEERRERREAATREMFIAQMNTLIQVVVQRPQAGAVSDWPQRQFTPSNPSTVGGVFNGNSSQPSDATTSQPPNQFG